MAETALAIELDVNQLKGEIAIAVVADTAKLTPVDVGTARSNWQVGVGGPPQGVRPAYSPHASRWRPPYASPGANTSETQNQAGVVWSAVANARKGGLADLYIANNSPYIGRLNQGHSNQAPAGFVETGISSGVMRSIKAFKFPNLSKVK